MLQHKIMQCKQPRKGNEKAIYWLIFTGFDQCNRI